VQVRWRGVRGKFNVMRKWWCNAGLVGGWGFAEKDLVYTLQISTCCKNRNETQPRYHVYVCKCR
jgi:hypothetical protein